MIKTESIEVIDCDNESEMSKSDHKKQLKFKFY